ncbi:MAG: hypothetical protein EXR82_00845 [Gammaproteobacteria bacterium]|nr:hypothetical protein [Gammaproteobacteria bacterium]
MSRKAHQLELRRAALRRRSGIERLEWQGDLQEIEGVFAGVDRGLSVLRGAATPPVLLAGGLLATLLLGRRRSGKLLLAGLGLAAQLVRRSR